MYWTIKWLKPNNRLRQWTIDAPDIQKAVIWAHDNVDPTWVLVSVQRSDIVRD